MIWSVDLALLAWIFSIGAAAGRLFVQLIFVQSVGQRSLEASFFAVIFGLIMTMYGVILIDAAGLTFFSRVFCSFALRLVVGLLVTLVVVVGPIWTVWRILNDTMGSRRFDAHPKTTAKSTMTRIREYLVIALTLVVYGGLIFISYKALPTFSSTSPDTDGSWVWSLIEVACAKVALFGVVGMGTLGGYAAFSTPYSLLLPYLVRNSTDQSRLLLQALLRRQKYLVSLWIQKKKQLALLVSASSSGGINSPLCPSASSDLRRQEEKKSFLSRVSSAIGNAVGGGTSGVTAEQLELECEGIQQVSMSIFLQTHEVQNVLGIAERGKTVHGVLIAILGGALSLYAGIKVFIIVFNVILRQVLLGNRDDVTSQSSLPRLLTLILMFGDVAEGDGPIGLTRAAVLFNAVMILLSLRGFLITIFRLTSQYATSIGARTTVVAFSTSMGAYFVAQVLMLRLQLPLDSSSVLADVLSRQAVQRYQRLNDLSFLLSCVGAFLLMRFVLRHDLNSID